MLHDLLQQKKAMILEKWFNLILDSYSPDSAQFFRQEKNQFANPVGYNLARDIRVLFEAVLSGENGPQLDLSLDNIIRIRAVQDFAPSQVVGFVFLLKKVINEEIGEGIRNQPEYGEWQELEARIDELALRVFDKYSECREKIYEIRINEIRARSSKLLKRTGFLFNRKEEELGGENS
jgi:RsbT co-antagonist protein rsbRD N-terminal domain